MGTAAGHQGGRLQACWAQGLLLLLLLQHMAALAASAALQTVSLVDACGRTLQGDGMVLLSHPDSRRYYFVIAGTDCQLTMQAASPRDRVQFQFRFFLVYSMLHLPPSSTLLSVSKGPLALGSPQSGREQAASPRPDPCTAGSYVQFYDGRDQTAKPLGAPLCGTTIPRPVLSSGSLLTLRLVTHGQQPRVDFVGDFTSVRTGLNASTCSTEEAYFPCRNGKCIPASLVCDASHVDNCGDGTDQAARPPAWCKARVEVIVQPPALAPPLAPGSVTRLPRLQAKASSASSSTSPGSPGTCTGAKPSRLLPPGAAPRGKADDHVLLVASLAASIGTALLLWCCWSPGWFVWRIGACGRLPSCPPACAACRLCLCCCCAHWEPAQVTPHGASAAPV